MLDSLYPIVEKKLHAAQIRDFELFLEKKRTRSYESKDMALESAKEAVQVGLSLRVFREGRVAFSYSTDLSEPGLTAMAVSAAAILPLVDPDEACSLPDPLPLPEKIDLQDWDDSLDAIPVSNKVSLAIELERAAKGFDPRVKYVRSATYEEEQSTWEIHNSRGLCCGHSKSDCKLVVMAVAESGGDAEAAYEFDFAPYFSRLDPEKIGRAAAKKAISYLGGITPTTRKCPVIFDPLISAEILEILALSFQGDEVYQDKTFLKGKLGRPVYSKKITLVDDGLLPGGAGTWPFDGEGQPGRTLVLMEGGVLKNFLLDSHYARRLGLKGNGSSSRRGFRKAPGISYANLILRPGDRSLNELARDAGEGILVTEAIGMHAANPISGEFSVGCQGFLVENGEIGRPIKKVAVAGNLHQMMAEVRGVGNQLRHYSNTLAPALLIESLTVSGN